MFSLPHDRPAVMGVLNVTPDSFSDGGIYTSVTAAVDAARRMMDDGADLIDVGGESTRPGAEPVSAEEEMERVIPVVERLVALGMPVSIDTMKAVVARVAVDAGAAVVNDVSALRDPDMLAVLAGGEVSVCLMHMQGTPATMQIDPHYDNVVDTVRSALVAAVTGAEAAGVARNRLWIDPGIGFGKRDTDNLDLLANIDQFVATGYPVLIGVSRKGFLGRILGGAGAMDRLPAALAIQVVAQRAGVRIIRTHDVLETRRAITAASALLATAQP